MSDDAIWLAELVARAMPREAEARGLLAPLTFCPRVPTRDSMIKVGWCCWKIKIGLVGTAWRSVAPTDIWRPLRFDSSPVIRPNHAIALSISAGSEAAPAEVDQIADRLSGYHLLHATRAKLLTALGDHAAARAANERALTLTHNPAEQQLSRARLGSDLLN